MSKSKAIHLNTYVLGFAASLVLTFGAYSLATQHSLSRRWLIAGLAALAMLQSIIQLVAFLHLNKELKPRWRLVALISMIGVVVILVFGSLWIMYNLNYHMNLKQTYQYLNNQGDGI